MGLLHLADNTRERRFTFLRIHQVFRSFLNLVLTVKRPLFTKLWPIVIFTIIIFYVREFALVSHFLENCTPLRLITVYQIHVFSQVVLIDCSIRLNKNRIDTQVFLVDQSTRSGTDLGLLFIQTSNGNVIILVDRRRAGS